jgi:hypothetical protein
VPGAQRAGAGIDHDHAALAQERQVGLRRRVLVHVVVHGRRHEDRARGGQRGRGQQVVGQAVGQLGDRVGRRRGDQEGVGVADQLEVAERVVLGRGLIGERAPGGVALELVGEDGAPVRAANDAAPTKRWAVGVWMTRTACPALVARRTTSSAL